MSAFKSGNAVLGKALTKFPFASMIVCRFAVEARQVLSSPAPAAPDLARLLATLRWAERVVVAGEALLGRLPGHPALAGRLLADALHCSGHDSSQAGPAAALGKHASGAAGNLGGGGGSGGGRHEHSAAQPHAQPQPPSLPSLAEAPRDRDGGAPGARHSSDPEAAGRAAAAEDTREPQPAGSAGLQNPMGVNQRGTDTSAGTSAAPAPAQMAPCTPVNPDPAQGPVTLGVELVDGAERALVEALMRRRPVGVEAALAEPAPAHAGATRPAREACCGVNEVNGGVTVQFPIHSAGRPRAD